MTAEVVDLRPLSATASDIPCPKCRAAVGVDCRNPQGKPLNNRPHHADRVHAHQEFRTYTVAEAVLVHDVPRTDLRKGDTVRTVALRGSPFRVAIVSTGDGDTTHRGLILFAQDTRFLNYTSMTCEQGRMNSMNNIRLYVN